MTQGFGGWTGQVDICLYKPFLRPFLKGFKRLRFESGLRNSSLGLAAVCGGMLLSPSRQISVAEAILLLIRTHYPLEHALESSFLSHLLFLPLWSREHFSGEV